MKIALFTLATLIIVNSLSGQPTIQWQQTFGGSKYDKSRSVLQTIDGGYIISGTAGSDDGDVGPINGEEDIWIIKLDSLGTLQWKKSFGGSNIEESFSIQQTSDAGFVIAGFSLSNDGDVSGNHGDYDAWIVKLDSIGELKWQKCLGGSGWEEAWDIQQTSDEGYIIAGRSGIADGDVTINHGSLDYWVVKLNTLGEILWQKSFGGGFIDLAYSVCQTSDGGYMVAGETSSSDGDVTNLHGNADYWVVKLNFEGKIEWQKTLGGSSIDRANDVQQTRDGGFVVLGQSRSNNGDVTGAHGGYDFWVVKLTESGTIEWQKALGGSGEDYGRAIEQTADNGFVVIGQTQSSDGDVIGNDGGADFWVVKLSENGEIQWQKTLGGSLAETGHAIKQVEDGGFVLTGDAWSNDGDVSGVQGYTDIWVVKLSPVTSGIGSGPPPLAPLEIYPNPVQDHLTVKMPTSSSNHTLSISDPLGRKCFHNTDSGETELDVSTLPEGFYIITVELPEGGVLTGKFCKSR